jgi:hypothetical protein
MERAGATTRAVGAMIAGTLSAFISGDTANARRYET